MVPFSSLKPLMVPLLFVQAHSPCMATKELAIANVHTHMSLFIHLNPLVHTTVQPHYLGFPDSDLLEYKNYFSFVTCLLRLSILCPGVNLASVSMGFSKYLIHTEHILVRHSKMAPPHIKYYASQYPCSHISPPLE